MRDKYAQEFRYSILKIEDYFSLLVVLIMGYLYFKSNNMYLGVIGGLAMIRLLYLIIRRWSNREVFVRINQKGIEFCKKNKFYSWDEITHTYIDTITKKNGNKSDIIVYLFVHTAGKRKKLNIDAYNYSEDKFNAAVKFYGGAQMGINPTADKPTVSGLIKEGMDWLSKAQNRWKAMSNLAFISGVFTMIGVIFLYRETLIDVKVILLFMLVLGLVGTFLFKKPFFRINGPVPNVLLFIYFTTVLGGFFSVGGLWYNKRFASKEIRIENQQITNKSFKIGKSHSCSAYVQLNGREKELMFGSQHSNLLKLSGSVEVHLKEGALGFDVLDNYQLLK